MYAFHGSLLHKSPGNHSLYDFSSNMGPIWVLITSKDASSQRGHSALLSALWKSIRKFGPIRVKFTKITREWPNFALRILIPSLSSLPPLLSHTNFTPHSNSNANGHLKQRYAHMQVQLHLVPKSLCLGAYGSQWEACGNHLKRMGHRMHTTIHKAKEMSAIAFI